MIVNLKRIQQQNVISWAIFLLKFIFFEFLSIKLRKTIASDRLNLQGHYKSEFPKMIPDDEGNTKCIGCKLCLDICPVGSLSMSFPNMVDFPPSLTIGEAPNTFVLNSMTCIKCGHCASICPVTAIELMGYYSVGSVDLLRALAK